MEKNDDGYIVTQTHPNTVVMMRAWASPPGTDLLFAQIFPCAFGMDIFYTRANVIHHWWIRGQERNQEINKR